MVLGQIKRPLIVSAELSDEILSLESRGAVPRRPEQLQSPADVPEDADFAWLDFNLGQNSDEFARIKRLLSSRIQRIQVGLNQNELYKTLDQALPGKPCDVVTEKDGAKLTLEELILANVDRHALMISGGLGRQRARIEQIARAQGHAVSTNKFPRLFRNVLLKAKIDFARSKGPVMKVRIAQELRR